MLRSDKLGTVNGNHTLINRIASLHAIYHSNQSQIIWFGQLVMHNPGAMVELRNEDVQDESEMVTIFGLAIRVYISVFCLDVYRSCTFQYWRKH